MCLSYNKCYSIIDKKKNPNYEYSYSEHNNIFHKPSRGRLPLTGKYDNILQSTHTSGIKINIPMFVSVNTRIRVVCPIESSQEF